jgi:hypothetical protein
MFLPPLRPSRSFLLPFAVAGGFALLFLVFFLPAFRGGYVLAPSDGMHQNWPAWVGERSLWTPDLFSGMPLFADPQSGHWYPPARILGALGVPFNGFVLLAYLLAAIATFGFVRRLTGSPRAGIAAGIVYSLGGFLIGHLAHTNVVHAAAWLPVLLLAAERLAERPDRRGAAWLALAVGMAILAGHPQVFLYSLVLALAWLAFRFAGSPRRPRLLVRLTTGLFLGGALAAILLVPLFELTGRSVRAELAFEEFVARALPVEQLSTLFFPYFFGWIEGCPYRIGYFGRTSLAECIPFAGIVPLVLALTAFSTRKGRGIAIFWAGTALAALLLALGDATPLAGLLFRVPVWRQFRVPGRHALELTFSIAVLAGLGWSALEKSGAKQRIRSLVVALGGIATAMAVAVGLVLSLVPIAERASGRNPSPPFAVDSLANPAIWVPFLVLLLSAPILFFWSRNPARRSPLLLALLVVDLGQFSFFFEWRYGSPKLAELEGPAELVPLARRFALDGERVLPLRGAHQKGPAPNRSRIWGFSNASGYNPLLLDSYSRLARIETSGPADPTLLEPSDRALDLLAVRWLFLPMGTNLSRLPDAGRSGGGMVERAGARWSAEELRFEIGRGCNPERPLDLRLPAPGEPVGRIAVVSSLACSARLPDGSPVVRIHFDTRGDASRSIDLAAGRDSAEWAFERPDLAGKVAHHRPPLFDSTPDNGAGGTFPALRFVSIREVPPGPPVDELRLEWIGIEGSARIDRISLEPAGRPGAWQPISPTLDPGGRFRPAGRFAETVSIVENLRARPRAWLVSECVPLSRESQLAAIRTSRLPDGRLFDPATTAVGGLPFGAPAADSPGSVESLVRRDDELEYAVRANRDGLLVLSEVFYPGWWATIDGRRATILEVDGALRGIVVPAGTHRVRLSFHPRSLLVGGAVSALAAAAVLFLLARRRGRGFRGAPGRNPPG